MDAKTADLTLPPPIQDQALPRGDAAARPFPARPHRPGKQPAESLIALRSPESFEADRYRVLWYRIENARPEGPPRVLAITSATPGDGKTTTAINLAMTIASTADRTALLIDADLRLSRVTSQLGIADARLLGLADLLVDPDLPFDQVVRQRPPSRASFVAAGRSLPSPCDALRSRRLEQIVERARQRFDFVIFDTPPVVAVPDCQAIARVVDGVLVVVGAHKTRRRDLQEALNALDPDKVTGLILNGDDVPAAHSYGRYYHRRK